MHYIGMDCHISTLEFAVVNEGGQCTLLHIDCAWWRHCFHKSHEAVNARGDFIGFD